jgi:SAM-dependent methyltransferase
MSGLYSLQHLRRVWLHSRAHALILGRRWTGLRGRLRAHGFDERAGRLLEIGCGRAYPYTALFSSTGVRIVGTDIDTLWPNHLRPRKYLRWVRHHGVGRTLRRGIGDLVLSRAYYPQLEASAGVGVDHRTVRLMTVNAASLAFRNASFDGAVSTAAFEHILDVPAAVAELARVLKPGGLADVEVHLFPSMTGGHDVILSNRVPPPKDFRVWGHLLDPTWRPPPVPLNRWREAQFRAAFEEHFDILDRVVTSTHGAEYVTDDLLRQLAQYSREDLSNEFVAFVLRRRS